jgi:hypothetical protein
VSISRSGKVTIVKLCENYKWRRRVVPIQFKDCVLSGESSGVLKGLVISLRLAIFFYKPILFYYLFILFQTMNQFHFSHSMIL